MSPVAFDMRTELQGEWEDARLHLIEQLDRLYANLGVLGPLIDALQVEAAALLNTPIVGVGYNPSAILTTNTAGTPSFSTALQCPLAFIAGNVLTPAVIGANTNDYNPTGLASAAIIRASASGAYNVTGLQAPSPSLSLVRFFWNIGAANNITLTNADVASAAVNRFRNAGAANKVVTPGMAVCLTYDVTSTVWQVF